MKSAERLSRSRPGRSEEEGSPQRREEREGKRVAELSETGFRVVLIARRVVSLRALRAFAVKNRTPGRRSNPRLMPL